MSDDGDVVLYQYQVENEEKKGQVTYSRTHKGFKFLDTIIEESPRMYHNGIGMALFKMAKANDFKKYYVVAMF
ncbi:hypothetical protein IV54_GL000679 [Levilactobacillus paucivorans]|uniref:N-acetyltransferase domain-containing protein n=1 Tax=Levilactobacillus paucivorans TaxID=616990 RepID=A0A0R2LZD0_9LACO|nr:hypothetical protein IV54_GL000679 [Levilactobacillus paucivorans]